MVVLPKGTLVHFRGVPFKLLADVNTEGLQSNYDAVVRIEERSGLGVVALSAVPDSIDSVDWRTIPCGNYGALGIDHT